LSLAIGADIRQKQIAKGNRINLFMDRTIADFCHPPFVDFVRAWPRQRHNPQRQLSSCGLRFQYRMARPVHRDALKLGIQGGQQTG
jgi:hypothetical protein